MAFPTSPVNNQAATVNNINYVYNSTSNLWTRVVTVLTSNVNPAIYLGKTTATTATTLIDTLPTTGNTSVSWRTTSTDSVNNQYKVSTIDSINNGTTVNYAEYGVVLSNVGTTVATFTSNITSGNINLYAVGNSSSVTVTFERTVLGSATASGYLNAGATGPAGTIANATNIAITDDTTTATTVYPTWVTTTTGNLPAKTSSTKMSFVPSTGTLTTSAHALNGSTSGSVTLNTVAVAGSNTATFPVATGTVMVSGNMPAFSAYANNSQTVTANTFTKMQATVEEFDTANAYDNATNYRFTPQVAGYYQVTGQINPSSTTSVTRSLTSIYKNGSSFKVGIDVNTATAGRTNATALIYLNGSTDYVEFYFLLNGVGTLSLTTSTGADNYFQAVMVRGA